MEQKAASICSESGNFLLLFAISIGSCTIATDDLDARMGLEPGDEGLCLAIWQEIDYLVGLQVHQDRAIPVAFFPGEIIHPQDLGRRKRQGCYSSYEA